MRKVTNTFSIQSNHIMFYTKTLQQSPGAENKINNTKKAKK